MRNTPSVSRSPSDTPSPFQASQPYPAPAGVRRYFDNAATSFPKPPEVFQAMADYASGIGASAGRGAYAEAQASAAVLKVCREQMNVLFHGENPLHFIFTLNCTDALNLAIKGILRRGDHVITTVMDHNSVLRPLNALAGDLDLQCTYIPVDPISCLVDPGAIRRALRPNTRLIAVVHASNVTGAVQPIREIGAIARGADIPLLVDAAQSAGHVPIDLQSDLIDLLAFPGHKGLLGPLGTGALYIRPGLEEQLSPLRHGGTGSISESDVQPSFMPDKFEAGSHNAIGLAGLAAGVAWILRKGVRGLQEHDRALSAAFVEGLNTIEGLRYFGPQNARDRVGVFSVQIAGMEPALLAGRLEQDFGILTRPGLHCAPLAHRHIGTVDTGGTTRFSVGPFLTAEDVAYATQALAAIAQSACAPVATH